ncbi:MAG: type 2 lantipeptide synthetase LanM (plasmid) [Dolichospermum sp. DET50]|nr:type 2 lantipeptide synthetase LanM [Dolichospermum sp. DET66]MBS3035922.1 type 2 lantipeptide synthetase LanM [Dolichospermum sp. DET67]MBS3041090.1 type 2 lantipeptide synthetase LanM [Dolichospermum sp. DET50]QSX70973.1 MAG: type 2 lantipeptide synthetase LanM family protein [Dolichospermum sp. DET69]
MNQQNIAWYQALRLTERITSIDDSKPLNPALAERKLKLWKSQTPFNDELSFQQRLEIDGITEEEFSYLLGESVENIAKRIPVPPNWLIEIEAAFSRSNPPEIKITPPAELHKDEKSGAFLYGIEPIISEGVERLSQGIKKIANTQSNLLFDISTIETIFLVNLPSNLLVMLTRTMVLEFNIACLQNRVSGNNTEEKFISFLESLQTRDIQLNLLQEYPVLARQLVIYIQQWVEVSLEFIQRLCADWQEICSTFSPGKEPGALVEINSNAGDSHRGGRSVIIAKFSSGLQIVYKPRSLAIDKHFQQLLTWINQRGKLPEFQTLQVIERGSYGWIEFVQVQSCHSVVEVEHFYQRLGGYLALLYTLDATDFHHENLIATGEQPILIDLESLFHPRIISDFQASLLTEMMMSESVLRVGLLPRKIWANSKSRGVDLSGIGGAKGQIMPHYIPQLQGVGSDKVQIIRKQIESQETQNRPQLNQAEVNVLEYQDAIIQGFTNVYELLLNSREELLAKSGILTCFESDEIRVILRPTQTYSLLLQESFHPHVLGNALERDRLFDKLWIDVQNRPFLVKVITSEQGDLWQGDIPIFTTYPNSCDVWNSQNQRLRNFLPEPSISQVRRRFQQLNSEDLKRQIWFIRASLGALAVDAGGEGWVSYRLSTSSIFPSSEELLKFACAVGDQLELLALHHNEAASWIGLSFVDGTHWAITPLGLDLYDGVSGIALFLAYLGEISQENRYTVLAEAALTTMITQIQTSKLSTSCIGGFTGWGGVIYTLTHLGVLWQKPELLNMAGTLVEKLPALICQDQNFDIIAGAAGCIASLLNLYKYLPNEEILKVAIKCGDRLIETAEPQEKGIRWISPFAGTKPLTGFAHGAAGIAWALLELAAVSEMERFHEIAIAAITYEQHANNVLLNTNNYLCTWCQSTPGIGLARLDSLTKGRLIHINQAEILTEIHTALKTTLTEGFGLNHSICHGDLGNIELLLQASQTIAPEYASEVKHLTASILHSITQHGWLCGTPLGVETPSLMTGIAGIGYGLLRLAAPERVPSVLLLAPPIKS